MRAGTLLYIAAISFLLTARTPRGRRAARLAWSIGCLLYLAHVWGAFQFFHVWSHQAAYEETARQSGELFGLAWGGGLYFNYLFTFVWLADVIWWWAHEGSYRRRPRWIAASIHAFMAFMFLNGAIQEYHFIRHRGVDVIYTQDRSFAGEKIYAPERNPTYNDSNYRSTVSLPGWQDYPRR